MTILSITQWIDQQEWSDEKKEAAKELHKLRMDKRLNPFTSGQWIKWGAERE